MVFFFNDTATTEIYTLSLHDALPILTGTISLDCEDVNIAQGQINGTIGTFGATPGIYDECSISDRKSTRLNSSHANISYAVFCLKKKKKTRTEYHMSELQSLKYIPTH